jgi:hypothetical protein
MQGEQFPEADSSQRYFCNNPLHYARRKKMKKMKWQEPKLIPLNKTAHGQFYCYPGSSAEEECYSGGLAFLECFFGGGF